ncbi:MAG: hypothetical protein IPG25_15430 [Proteobacteria bacterium]|jgi:hypothetical protein|nr:hypothetical protein [Pseudomonadota bacterium]
MTINEMMDAIDGMREALDKIDTCDDAATKFALAHSVKMLGLILRSGDLHACRRRGARSVYRMGCAALGIEEEAA